jgi:hypothetical protein
MEFINLLHDTVYLEQFLDYFPKMKVGLSNHQFVCLSVCLLCVCVCVCVCVCLSVCLGVLH